MLNIYHLELFHHVVRNGGISEAVRHLPCGIQQPAVSARILQFVDHLEVTPCPRRPLGLTAAGEELLALIEAYIEHGVSKLNSHVFQILTARLQAHGIAPDQILMVSDHLDNDPLPRRRSRP